MPGRRGQGQTKEKIERKNFKWEPFHMEMANYLRDNYDNYKSALANNRKIAFLRLMQNAVGAECSEIQLKNGFYNFLKKYSDVKQKLNSSGFGIDPEKDKSLDKGWVLKACPYFDILDEVMGTRPNVTPPFIVSTSATALKEGGTTTFDTQGPPELDQTRSFSPEETGKDDEETSELLDIDENSNPDLDCDKPKNGHEKPVSTEPTMYYVKKALKGIDMKRKEVTSMKSPMGVFAKVMENKTTLLAEVEQNKLELQKQQFESEQMIAKERNEIERNKVEFQMNLETQRIELERERLAERRAEREHEMKILQMKHDFELKKMKLNE